MPDQQEPRLSLSEWLVLCLVCEEPAHGFALLREMSRPDGLGQVWRVNRTVVYRALSRLEKAGLLLVAGVQLSDQGPSRTVYKATPAGRQTARKWLNRPVAHARDVRSELLVKLALLARSQTDSLPLLRAQKRQLAPIAAVLDDRLTEADGFDHTVALWRHEGMAATMRFLDALTAAAAPPPTGVLTVRTRSSPLVFAMGGW